MGRVLPSTIQLISRYYVFLHLDVKQPHKILHFSAWAVFPQEWPSSSHGVEKLFHFDVKQPFKIFHFYAWAVLPHLPKHNPAKFTFSNLASFCSSVAFQELSLLRLGRAPPSTAQLISLCQTILFILMLSSHSKAFSSIPGPYFPKHGPAHITMSNNLFILMLNNDPKQVLKNSHFYAWAVLPHFPKHDPAQFTVSNIASSCS